MKPVEIVFYGGSICMIIVAIILHILLFKCWIKIFNGSKFINFINRDN